MTRLPKIVVLEQLVVLLASSRAAVLVLVLDPFLVSHYTSPVLCVL
jgi:hypothetical protein